MGAFYHSLNHTHDRMFSKKLHHRVLLSNVWFLLSSVKSKGYYFQHSRTQKGEEPGRGKKSPRERELRVLRACKDAAAAWGHYISARQGFHSQAYHCLPQVKDI